MMEVASEKKMMEEKKNQLIAANKARALETLLSISLQLSRQVSTAQFSRMK